MAGSGNTPHEADKHPVCGAKTRIGGICQQPALANGRCHYHGGKSLKGAAVGTFKTGRYSKYMPARLLERYHEAANDPELLNLQHEIALIDARLADLLTRVDSGEARTIWEKARKTNQEIQKAVHDENYGRMMVMCLDLDRLIGDGLADYDAWGEIQSLLDARRKLVESERKRRIEMQQMVTAEDAMTLVVGLLNAVKQHVNDRDTLNAIQNEFISLVSAGDRVGANSRPE